MQTIHLNPKQGERRSGSEAQQTHRGRLRHLFTRTRHLQPTAQTVQEGPGPTEEEASQEAQDEESGRKRPRVGGACISERDFKRRRARPVMATYLSRADLSELDHDQLVGAGHSRCVAVNKVLTRTTSAARDEMHPQSGAFCSY